MEPTPAPNQEPKSWLGDWRYTATLLAGICLPGLSGCSSREEAPARPESPANVARLDPQPPATAPQASTPRTIDPAIEALQKKLETEGLTGLVHGARQDRGLLVFVYNDPQDFFTRYHFSMLAANAEVRKTLATLGRNDVVHVKGKLSGLDTEQPHLRISELEVKKRYEPGVDAPAGRFISTAKLPAELRDRSEISALVHAIVFEGKVVVLDYKDAVVPLVVPDGSLTKDLYRGDRVTVRFKIQDHPGRPVHLALDPDTSDGKKPLQVTESIAKLHDKHIEMEGQLVLFPKSPTINRDVWAVQQKGPDGASRFFTLVNFKAEADGSFRELERIDEKLRKAWNEKKDSVQEGRNNFINTGVRVKASGIAKVESQSQANVQIHLRAEDLELTNPK